MINYSDLKYTYGTVMRYMISPEFRLSLRLDFGFSKNTSGVYLLIGEAFQKPMNFILTILVDIRTFIYQIQNCSNLIFQ